MIKVVSLAVSLVMIFGLYGVADAQKKPVKKSTEKKVEQPVEEKVEQPIEKKVEIKEVSVFGVTLGKPFEDSKIQECSYKSEKIGRKDFKTYNIVITPEKPCYKESYGNIMLNVPTGWFVVVTFDTEGRQPDGLRSVSDVNRCKIQDPSDRLKYDYVCLKKSKVTEINISFSSEGYDEVFDLMSGKFGKPSKCEKSIVQNKMGATFDNIICTWAVGNGVMVLNKRYTNVDKGHLQITHVDLFDKKVKHIKEKSSQIKDQF